MLTLNLAKSWYGFASAPRRPYHHFRATLTNMAQRVLALPGFVAALAAVGYAAAIGSVVLGAQHVDSGFALATQLPALGLVTAGLMASRARPTNPLGALLTFGGVVACLWPTQAFVSVPLLFTASLMLGDLWAGVVAHVLLAFPSGRLPNRISRAGAATVYAYVLPFTAARALGMDPAAGDCVDCGEAANLLYIDPPAWYSDALAIAELPLTLALSAFLAWELIRRWRGASAARRRILRLVYIGGIGYAVAVFVREAIDGIYVKGGGDTPGIYYVADAPPIVASTILMGCLGGLVGFLYLGGLLRTRLARSGVGGLMERIGSITDPVELREPLARALGDPTLDIAFWAPAVDGYVDATGRPVALPPPESGRAITLVEDEEGPLAALVHDPAVLEDEGVAGAAGAAARLALERARLQAELRAQLEAVRDSRARIAQAADEERRKIERDLHDGAQQRLVAIGLALRHVQHKLADDSGAIREDLDAAVAEVTRAIEDLRDLTHGLHPQVLMQEGLGAALRSLASRSPLAVDADIELVGRLPAAVEACGYFVCSEALANAAKHAATGRAAIRARHQPGRLTLEVRDDGAGGASLDGGSGLRGLRDRVEALGGSLEVVSPPGGGTRLTASIPVGRV